MTQADRISRLILAALLALVLGTAGDSVLAQSREAVARVEPSELDVREGKTAQVQVLIEDADGVYGYQFVLLFDPALVEVVDADPDMDGVQLAPGDFLEGQTYVGINRADNGAGRVQYAVTLLDETGGRSGSGILATATLKAKHTGTARFRLGEAKLASTDATSLPVEVAEPAATPPPSPNPGPETDAEPAIPSLAIINGNSPSEVVPETSDAESGRWSAGFPPPIPVPDTAAWTALAALVVGYVIGRYHGRRR